MPGDQGVTEQTHEAPEEVRRRFAVEVAALIWRDDIVLLEYVLPHPAELPGGAPSVLTLIERNLELTGSRTGIPMMCLRPGLLDDGFSPCSVDCVAHRIIPERTAVQQPV